MKSERCKIKKSENTRKCTYCGKQFKYDSERRRHEQSHTPQFECKICTKKFSFISALRRHEKQHERKGSVICSECNRKFRDETLLKRHIKYAHKGTFICAKCNATYNSDVALRLHMKTHKPESERRFRCSIKGCNKSFNFSHHLKHHEMSHTDKKQYFCNTCGKGFIQSHHLKSHLKSHKPEDWLQCTVTNCNKKFATEYARKRHLGTHKIKLDSGISSDSSSTCDALDLDIKASKVSTSHRQATHLINGKHIDILESANQQLNVPENFDTSEEISDMTVQFENNRINVIENVPVKLDSNEYSQEEEKIEDFFRSCKTVLGSCIMSHNGEVNENCLCAQISSSTVEDHDSKPHKGRNSSVNSDIRDVIKISDSFSKSKVDERNLNIESNINICGGCKCGGNVNTDPWPLQLPNNECSNAINKTYDAAKIPELENRTDGIIKIKETFDFDIEMESDTVGDDFQKVLFPLNSCKSVLGKCIVSGNGTIGEGCFCAKMALGEDSASAEEIEEITPCPIVN